MKKAALVIFASLVVVGSLTTASAQVRQAPSCPTPTPTPDQTYVVMSWLNAAYYGQDKSIVRWQTATEWSNIGFNVYLAMPPAYRLVILNDELIPSKARGVPIGGAEYEYVVLRLRGACYYVGAVDVRGGEELFGPACVTQFYLPLVWR